MTALLVNGRFLAQGMTGVQRFAQEMARALAALGPLEVLAPPGARGEASLPVRQVGVWRGQAWEQLDLPRHARGGVLVNLGNTAPLALRRQVVVIHDAATMAVPGSYGWRFRTWYRWLHRALAWRGVVLATVSDFSRREVARHLGVDAGAIAVVGEGAEHILRGPADTGLLGRLGIAGPYVLAVGSLAPHKNLAALGATARMLAGRGASLVVTGDLDGRVFAAAALPQPARAIGRVDDAGCALYEQAACFVFPSRYEGFGLPAVEAMACGCPVVAARAGALPEVCGEAAVLADPSDPSDIATAVARVLDEPGLADRLREAGRVRAAGFTWEAAARRIAGACGGMKVAIVHEWLQEYAGSERVLEQMLLCYPEADLFAVVDFLPPDGRFFLHGRTPRTSFIQRLPFARRLFRHYLGLMPLAMEQLDMSGYDLVLSNSHAVAKGVLTGPDTVHVSYVHSPMRYAWDLQHQYLRESGLDRGLRGMAARLLLARLRRWDRGTANGVDLFLANSSYIARRIHKTYRREALVVPPPVDINVFTPDGARGDTYLVASRHVAYKRVDLVAAAFASMPERKLLIVGDGPAHGRVRAAAAGAANITFRPAVPQHELVALLRAARGFVFAGEEDFGIVLAEALACGTPVVAFGRGGARDIVAEGAGVLFDGQTPAAIVAAVARLEDDGFDPGRCRGAALRFAPALFRDRLEAAVQGALGAERAVESDPALRGGPE